MSLSLDCFLPHFIHLYRETLYPMVSTTQAAFWMSLNRSIKIEKSENTRFIRNRSKFHYWPDSKI